MDLFLTKMLYTNNLGIIIWGYIISLSLLVLAIINIIAIDKIEFDYNIQSTFCFKRNVWFVFQKSKIKNIVSKKTFILETLAYFLIVLTIIFAIVGLFFSEKISIIVLGLFFFIDISFTCVTSAMLYKTQKYLKLRK